MGGVDAVGEPGRESGTNWECEYQRPAVSTPPIYTKGRMFRGLMGEVEMPLLRKKRDDAWSIGICDALPSPPVHEREVRVRGGWKARGSSVA